MKCKKPLKENKYYIAAIILACVAVMLIVLTAVLWNVGVIGQACFAFGFWCIPAAIITFSLGYAKNHPEEIKNKVVKKSSKPHTDTRAHINVWDDENWEQKSEDEKEWEDIEFFEMMEDD